MGAAGTLRDYRKALPEEDHTALLATVIDESERLSRFIANLLDMSRLQAGALGVHAVAIGVEDVVPRALDELGPPAAGVRTDIPADLPAATSSRSPDGLRRSWRAGR